MDDDLLEMQLMKNTTTAILNSWNNEYINYCHHPT